MTADLEFDQIVGAWLAEDGAMDLPPGALDLALISARGARQRRGIRALMIGPTHWPPPAGRLHASVARRGLRLVIVGVVLLALVGVTLFVGSLLPRREPINLLGVAEPTDPMVWTRYTALATTLHDGRVLVTGATGTDQVVTAELFDPSTGTFHAAGSMDVGTAPGGTAAQAPLADGRLLVLGSTGGQRDGRFPYQAFARIYDPATDTFRPTTSFPGPANGYRGTLLDDGRVRFVRDVTGGEQVDFDPVAETYTVTDQPAADAPSDVNASATLLRDGRFLVIGSDHSMRDYVAIVDPRTGLSTPLDTPDLTAGDAPMGVLLPDGRVLLLGALSGIFDPDSLAYVPLHIQRPSIVLRLEDGRILLSSEEPGWLGGDGALLSIFDPATATLTPAPTKVPEGCCAAWVSLEDGRVLGVGGLLDDLPSRNAYIFE